MRIVTREQAMKIAADSEAAGTASPSRFQRDERKNDAAALTPTPSGGAGPTVLSLRLKKTRER